MEPPTLAVTLGVRPSSIKRTPMEPMNPATPSRGPTTFAFMCDFFSHAASLPMDPRHRKQRQGSCPGAACVLFSELHDRKGRNGCHGPLVRYAMLPSVSLIAIFSITPPGSSNGQPRWFAGGEHEAAMDHQTKVFPLCSTN
jgi:hypothetical protein